jgi:hypothetical protein
MPEEYLYIVKCDNGDLLNKMQSVKWVMVMGSGTLQAHRGCYKLIDEYNGIKSVDDEYYCTGKTGAQRDWQHRMKILRESIAKEARISGVPEDIMLNTKKNWIQ